MASKRPKPVQEASNELALSAPIVRANVNREVIVSPDFVSIYANDTQVLLTPWDVRLTFGEISEVKPDPPTIVVKTLGDVRISPQHAKKLLQVLGFQVAQYEKNIGVIPLPPD
jgi:hypothetical protein